MPQWLARTSCVRLVGVCGTGALILLAGLLLAAAPRQELNLLQDAGFENAGEGWASCGGVQLIDAQDAGVTPLMVHRGRYAARLGYPATGNECPAPALLDTPLKQLLVQAITIPADAPALTVSFWYSVITEAPHDVRLNVYLTSRLADPLPVDGGATGVQLTYGVNQQDFAGWHLWRRTLTAHELRLVKAVSATLYLLFDLQKDFPFHAELTNSDRVSFYIDDVRVATADERTAASPLPDALRGDNSQPLTFVRSEIVDQRTTTSIYRMDTDGSNALRLFTSPVGVASTPVWSGDGRRIALHQDTVAPPGEPDLRQVCQISILTIINADGGRPHEAGRTACQPSEPPRPLNCEDDRDPDRACARREVPAIFQVIEGLDWSPDGQRLAIQVTSGQRYNYGRRAGQVGVGTVRIELYKLAAKSTTAVISAALDPSWSTTNQLLFRSWDVYDSILSDQRSDGLWWANVQQQPPRERRLLPNAIPIDALQSKAEDQHPSWAPDGQRFVTVRQVAGDHIVTVLHDDVPTANHVITLFDRRDLDHPRALLLVDHGDIEGPPTWSPDGAYLVYTLRHGSRYNLWWLEVASGKTGPITTDGESAFADWRPAGAAE